MRPLASIPDLEILIGCPVDPERADAILRSASAEVRAAAGQTWADADGELVDVPEHIRVATVRLAARMWSNPTGVKQESAGPYSRTNDNPYLSDDEIASLRASVNPTGGLTTISTTRGAVETRNGLLAVEGGAPIPHE